MFRGLGIRGLGFSLELSADLVGIQIGGEKPKLYSQVMSHGP